MEISQKLKDILIFFKDVDFSTLSRTQELGQVYNFDEAVTNLSRIHEDLMQVVNNAKELRISDEEENQITNIAVDLKKYIDAIRNFVVQGNEANAHNQRQAIHENAKNLYQRDLDIIVPKIDRIQSLNFKPDEIKEQTAQARANIKEIQKIKKEAEKEKENVQIAIKEVRDAFGKEGALISIEDFKNQAEKHEILAKWWFGGAIGAITLIILYLSLIILDIKIFGHSFGFSDITSNDYVLLAQQGVTKLVLLSILYLIVHQTVKNYKVNRHLYITNNHRQLAIQVYPFMTKATKDPAQSNIILAQAVKAVFDPCNTGYLDKDESTNPISFTEIINKIANKENLK